VIFLLWQENTSSAFREKLQEKLKPYADFLGDKQFVVSDKPTLADFHFYELLEILKGFHPDAVNAYPTLVAYLERFANLPAIKALLESTQ